MAIFANGLGGSIGRRLAARLEGTTLVRLSSADAPDALPCDLRKDVSTVAREFSRGDVLLFLAAMSKPNDCASNPHEAWLINVVNTSRLVGAALEAGAKVVFFSSDTVYGNQRGPLTEHAPLLATEPYGKMKAAVEKTFADTAGFTSLRLSYVVSLEDPVTRYLYECAHHGRKGEMFSRYARNMVWIEDVIQTVLVLVDRLEKGQESPPAINVGGSECTTRCQMAAALRDAGISSLEFLEMEPPEAFFAARPERIELDVSLMTSLLGRKPTSLKDAYARELENKGLQHGQTRFHNRANGNGGLPPSGLSA